ncbi:MAG: diheme cytochrome c, partial [Gammaproteobacteria bacterium]|nr:diheme cytochrome c [Gammaproteobacteria bacterium]
MKNLLTVIKFIGILAVGIYPLTSPADGGVKWSNEREPGVSAVEFQQYNQLCGSCHFPFQPGLLPTSSWEKIMTGTDAHFGEQLKLTAVEKRTMMR